MSPYPYYVSDSVIPLSLVLLLQLHVVNGLQFSGTQLVANTLTSVWSPASDLTLIPSSNTLLIGGNSPVVITRPTSTTGAGTSTYIRGQQAIFSGAGGDMFR